MTSSTKTYRFVAFSRRDWSVYSQVWISMRIAETSNTLLLLREDSGKGQKRVRDDSCGGNGQKG